MTQTIQNRPMTPPPVVVQKVVKLKKRRSLVEFLVGTVILLSIVIIVGAFLAFSAWMYTYNALTEEKIVAELSISKKVVKDGVPTYTVRYTPLQQDAAFSFLGSNDSNGKVVQSTMSGDQVFVDANFIRWENWMTLLGFKPVYKVYRVKSDFKVLSERDKFKSTAFDMNGGSDQFVEDFAKGDASFGWFVQGAFISSAGQNITDEDQVYNVIVTKDAIVLEKK